MLFPQSLDEIRSVEKQERFRHIDGDCALLTRSAMYRDEDARARTDADLSCGAQGCPESRRPSRCTLKGVQEGRIDTGEGTGCSSRNRICRSASPCGTAHSLVCRSQTAEYGGERIFIARSRTLLVSSAQRWYSLSAENREFPFQGEVAPPVHSQRAHLARELGVDVIGGDGASGISE
jgi:hypothetical protein